MATPVLVMSEGEQRKSLVSGFGTEKKYLGTQYLFNVSCYILHELCCSYIFGKIIFCLLHFIFLLFGSMLTKIKVLRGKKY